MREENKLILFYFVPVTDILPFFWVPAGSKSNPKPYEVFAVVNQFVHFKVLCCGVTN